MHVASLILKHEMWFVLGECSHVLGKETHLTGLSSSRLIAVPAHTEDKVKKYTIIMVIIGSEVGPKRSCRWGMRN